MTQIVATGEKLLRQVKIWQLSVAMSCEQGKVFAYTVNDVRGICVHVFISVSAYPVCSFVCLCERILYARPSVCVCVSNMFICFVCAYPERLTVFSFSDSVCSTARLCVYVFVGSSAGSYTHVGWCVT